MLHDTMVARSPEAPRDGRPHRSWTVTAVPGDHVSWDEVRPRLQRRNRFTRRYRPGDATSRLNADDPNG